LLVLANALTAGKGYLWCSMMQQAVETCCCEPKHTGVEAPSIQGSELRSGCCEQRGHDELTKGLVVSGTIEVPPATPVAVVVPVATLAATIPAAPFAPNRAPSTPRARSIRAGPRAAAHTCAWLQVFRC
jgi:hypothetical protein